MTTTYRKGGVSCLPIPMRLSVAGLVVLAVSLTATVVQAGNVGRSGVQLTHDGAPYRPVGFNGVQVADMPGGFVCHAAATSDEELNLIFVFSTRLPGAG